jgi:HlyD family secretion protein
MDRELPAGIIRKNKIKKFTIASAVVLFVIICVMALRAVIAPTVSRNKIRTSIAETGAIEATVSASGVVMPEFEQIITSPVNSTIEKVFLRSGDSLRAGQSILELNKDQLLLTNDQLQDELDVQKNKKQQLSLDTEKRLIDLQASYEIKSLQARFVESQYDRVKRLHEIGGATAENLERAELNAEIARRELDQSAEQIDNQQASLKVALEGLDLQISIQENRISEIRRQIDLAEARAGGDGIITFVNENIGSSVATGDVIARVADLGSFRIEAGISDIHADKLKPGGLVRVRIGEKRLSGRIGNVRPAVENGIMKFTVDLDEKSDRSLRPNLRADVFVVISFRDNVVRVENGPFFNGVVDQEVFIVSGDRAIRKIVDIGISNFDYVEITGDIAPGDEVIITDMKKYSHMSEVEITSD